MKSSLQQEGCSVDGDALIGLNIEVYIDLHVALI
jgi:hypothetical protein